VIVVLKVEDRLDNSKLGSGSVETAESSPIIDNHTRTNNIGTTVHSTSGDGNLEEDRELMLLLNRGLGVNDSTLIAKRAVGANKHVLGNRLTEDFDTKHILDDILSSLIDIRVNKSNVIVTNNTVTESRQLIFDSSKLNVIRKSIAKELELLISGSGRNKKTVLVAGSQTTNDTGTSNSAVNDGDDTTELSLEDAIEVLGATRSDKAIAVC
jgi:hypothetical protein